MNIIDEVPAFAFVICAEPRYSIQQMDIPETFNEQPGQLTGILPEIAHEFHQAQLFVRMAQDRVVQRNKGMVETDGYHDQPCEQQYPQLVFRDLMHFVEIEEGFPRFEDIFNSPPQPVKRHNFGDGNGGVLDGYNED